MRHIPALSLGLLLVIALPTAADKKTKLQEANELFERARSVSGFRYEGARPFRMRAHIQIGRSKKPKAQGEYELLWKSPREWRETFTFPDYSETRFAAEGGYRVARDKQVTPTLVRRAVALMFYGSSLDFDEESKVRRIRDRKKSGKTSRCVEISHKKLITREVCFDANTGATASEESPLGKTEHSDFQENNGRWFPRKLRYRYNGRLSLDASVTSIVFDESISTDSITAPPDSVLVAWCSNPSPPRRTIFVQPEYPTNARMGNRSGTVVLDVRIGADGRPRVLEVENSAGAALDRAAIAAVEKWRYSPARCGEQGVEMHTEVEINFSVG